MKKSILIIMLAILAVIFNGCSDKRNNVNEKPKEENEVAMSDTDEEVILKDDEEDTNVNVRSRTAVINEMHNMSNTLIVADDIWTEEDITDSSVSKLIKEVSSSDFKDKERLLEILERWKEEDFSQGVTDHNYLWNQLGGTIGRATALREQYK
ncbi:DUF6241 domain-containing protein [Clostridium sp. DL1XJH146]